MYPQVIGYGSFDVESFAEYYLRWPAELSAIPESVVRDWIYRHWSCFQSRWIDLKPHTWSYELVSFTNSEILAIDHVGNWIADLDLEGQEYVSDTPRARASIGQYMLTHGTFPVPIIVAKNAGHIIAPRSGGAHMKEPLQLIEGHCRLACIRGMINSQHPELRDLHEVWLVTIPGGGSNNSFNPTPLRGAT